MKRIISLMIAMLLIASLAACTGIEKPADPTEGPEQTAEAADTAEPAEMTEEPTEAPAEEPTEAPAEEPTEEPAQEPVAGISSYFTKLEVGVPYEVDFDLDGTPDTIEVAQTAAGEYYADYRITITRACAPEKPLKYDIQYAYDVYAWILDCDTEDNTLDLVASYDYDSDDWTCIAVRMKADGSDLALFESYMAIPEISETFTGRQGFVTYTRFDVLGTYDLESNFTVDDTGFVFAEGGDDLEGSFGVYTYPEYEDFDYSTLTLLMDMDVYPLCEDGSRGGVRTVPAGDTITPVRTDGESFVVLRLSDGILAEVDLAPMTGEDEWGYLINGIDQNEYAEIPYAD